MDNEVMSTSRTPEEIVAVRPLKDGVIADFEITARMLQHFLRKAVEDAAYQAGARQPVTLLEEPMAAAIGA